MRFIAFGALGGLFAVFTSWLITGVLFHRFQALTPETWRPEGPREYTISSILQVFSGAAIGLLFWHTGGLHIGRVGWLETGFIYGILLWLALALPIVLSMALFIRLHRGMVVGILLQWLVSAQLATLACAWAQAT